MVPELIPSLQQLGHPMSDKMHFLNSHLAYFAQIRGHYSDEHDERFHQDISSMETVHRGTWHGSVMAGCCWSLKRNAQHAQHNTKSKLSSF